MTRRPSEQISSITSASESPTVERNTRIRRYLISMGIRFLCFVSAILVGPGWLRWVLVAGAVFLPYVAVVGANTRLRRDHPGATAVTVHRGSLPPGAS